MAKKGDKLGTLVFKDVESKEILIWKHIESEIVQDYRYLKEELLELGYTITSVTLDGKTGLYKAFNDIPMQMCHFHPVLALSLRKENYTAIYYNEAKTRGISRVEKNSLQIDLNYGKKPH